MERSLFRYIFHHTWRQQVWLLVVTAVSFPLIYVNLELPKMIVNNAIGGRNIPETVLGVEMTQVSYLMILSFTLLALITVNGGIKYYLNVYRGVIGERMVRRLRHQLYSHVLRFPLPHFKRASAGEIIPMVTAETDPIGGFIGDSVGLPAFQGGLLLTYLIFIFMQDFWLGMAAIALYPPQIWLIPRLQRKINQLSKQRIQTTRALSDRIGDTVAGAAEIRANDTSRYERADVSERLSTIYRIRVEIYNRKYFVKFLNNFLAQITPFFFYSVGGYFVINGQLSLGALVAVLAAYKDLVDPWKELLKWYETKEDVRVKYEQIVSQFEPPGLMPLELTESPPEEIPRLSGKVVASGVTYSEDGLVNDIERMSFEIAPGEHVAVLGVGRSGKDDVARLLARLTLPTGGRLAIGPVNLAAAHEVVIGARIAYVSQNAHVFSGTLGHNLYYGLKHRPSTHSGISRDAAAEAQRIREARATSNSVDDIRAEWVDFAAAGVEDGGRHTLDVLRLVEMEDEVMTFGLGSTLDPAADPALTDRVLAARARFGERAASPELQRYIELFDRDRYHLNTSVAENLLFGTPLHPDFQYGRLAHNAEVRELLRDVGLLEKFDAAGEQVARLMVELFADVPPESELFAQYSFINPDDLADFQRLLKKIDDRSGRATVTPAERELLLALPFKIVMGRHRLGVFDESVQQQIVEARAEFQRRFAARGVVDFLDPERYSPALSIQDNILFGRVAWDQADAQPRVATLVRELAIGVGLEEALMDRGLEYEVGASGARLSYVQKQKLAIARALMKNPDVLVFDEPTAGLDPHTERRVMDGVRGWAEGRTLVWTLGRADLAQGFDRVLVLEAGRLVEQGSFSELEQSGRVLKRLLAA